MISPGGYHPLSRRYFITDKIYQLDILKFEIYSITS